MIGMVSGVMNLLESSTCVNDGPLIAYANS